jgi:hypothetical protein
MGLVSDLKRFKRERVQALPARIIRETLAEFAGSLVTDWTPLGAPETWKSAPPADYRPGNLQSSWFLSVGAPSGETTTATDHREVWHLERLADLKAGETVYFSNSAPHAGAIEGGHSAQAPVGILVNGPLEFERIVHQVAGRLR